ncbi:MAG: type II secretion system protein GspK, partial [Ramlibacter sp.]
RMVENLRFASDTSANNRSSPMAPLAPQRVEQLVWLGIPVQTVAVLQPYVTILPVRETPVNLNTASAEVIYAAVDGLNMAEAQRLVAERERAPFRSIADAKRAIGASDITFPEGTSGIGVATRFFEIRARLRLEQLVVEERSVLQRDGLDVKVLLRERGIPDPTALAQAAARR